METIPVLASNRRMAKKRILTIVIASLCGLGLTAALGRDAVELESRYAGDGWFEYRLRTLEDPFFAGIDFYQLTPYPFTNYVASTLPLHWTNFYSRGEWHGLMYDRSVPQPRLNEISFSVRSSARHFRRENLGFSTSIYVEFVSPYYYFRGLGGYLILDCLVPCAPEEADGSPDSLVSRRELIPDIKIDELILTNGEVRGVRFSWSEPSTVELQSSLDLAIWGTVARIFGNPPQTTWTTNVALNSFGKFFRLSLVANRHLTNALATALPASQSRHLSGIPIKGQELIHGQVRHDQDSLPAALLEVNRHGRITARGRNEASRTPASLLFDIRELRSAALLQAQMVESESREPDGAANGSQPIRSETNRTSVAAGSRR